MAKKILIYRILSHLTTVIWLLVGILTIYSIVNGTTGYIINLIMGSGFMVISFYLYLKSQTVIKILTDKEYIKESNLKTTSTLNYFLRLEMIFIAAMAFTGLILLSATISRTFFEKLPIFG